MATNYGVTGWSEGIAFASALSCFEHWRSYRGTGDTEGLQIKEAVTAYLEMYGDCRFTSITDNTQLHGERSGYWRDDFSSGRQWLFTKSGLQQATKGYDIKQVVDALKAAGWLMLDNEGKSATRANFKNNETNENRFYVLCLTNTVSTTDTTDEKQGGTATDHEQQGSTTRTTQVPDKGRL